MTRPNERGAQGWVKDILLEFQSIIFTKFVDFIAKDKELSDDEKAAFERKVKEFNKKEL